MIIIHSFPLGLSNAYLPISNYIYLGRSRATMQKKMTKHFLNTLSLLWKTIFKSSDLVRISYFKPSEDVRISDLSEHLQKALVLNCLCHEITTEDE